MEARLVLRLFAIVSLIQVCIGVDPCVDYDLMWMENGLRSSDFDSQYTDVSICDAILNSDTWYRFEHDAGDRLIETPVEPWHCGTQAPIWLNGTHPTAATEVAGEVCATYSSRNTCGWNATVRIRLCNESGSEFFVYLLAVPPGCALAYCVDAASRKQCTPPLVWLDEEFRCGEETTMSPTHPPTATPSSPTESPSSGWTSWGPWSICSKPCDYGMQTRKRACGKLPCEGPANSNQLCIQYNCPDLPEEEDKGIVLLLQSADYTSETMLKVVENQRQLNTIIRNSINKICSRNASLCCGHTIDSISTALAEYVTSSDIYVAQGFPRPKSEWVVSYQIIAIVNEDVDKAICRGNHSKRRSVRQVQSASPKFVSYEVMEMATKESIATIEQKTGLYVTGYSDPAITLPDDANHDDSSCPPATCFVPIIVCCTVIPSVVMMMIGCICIGMKNSKTKPGPEPSPLAKEYIKAREQRNIITVLVGLFTFTTSVDTGQEQIPKKPSQIPFKIFPDGYL